MPECDTDRTIRTATLSAPQRAQLKRPRDLRSASRHAGMALVASAILCLPGTLLAQEPAAPAPVTEAKPLEGAPAAPQPIVQAVAPSEQPAQAAPGPEPAALKDELPPPPPPPPSAAPILKIGMGVRTGLGFAHVNPRSAGPNTRSVSLNDGLFDLITIRPYFSAQLHKNIGVVANFDIETGSGFNILDAIAQFKVVEEFQIWVGQHIPANDRNNFCGPFFANTWNFGVVVNSYPMDFAARDRGITFWGLLAGGILKYQASVVDLQPGRKIENARYAGRLTLNLLDPENYYYSSGTYFGAQDVLSFGAVFSYQKGLDIATTDADGDPGPTLTDNDFVGFSFDALFEKRLGRAGTLTVEGGYWNFEYTGKQYVVNQGSGSSGSGFVSGPGQSALAGVSYLLPQKMWIGQLQPNVKFQYAGKRVNDPALQRKDSKVVDIGLGYIIDGYNHQWRANFRHGNTHMGKENSFQLGVQFQI
jgi:hypothetical protein